MKYVLSTNDVNRYGYKVLTEGITWDENATIPILLSHNTEKVLGKWVNFEKTEDGKLLAEAEWDTNDPDVAKTVKKIQNGYIEGVSIGATYKDGYVDENDTLIVTEAELLEASVTPLPANKNAKKLSLDIKLEFEGGKNIDELKDMLKEKDADIELDTISNNRQKHIAKKVKEDKKDKELSKDDKNEKADIDKKGGEDEKKPAKKTKRSPRKKDTEPEIKNEVSTDETVKISLSELPIELQDSVDITEALKNYINSKDKIIAEYKEKVIELEKVIKEKDAKISEIELDIKKKEYEIYLTDAKKSGKINNKQYDTLLKMSLNGYFDDVKEIVEASKISLAAKKITSTITVSTDNGKDFEWYQKNDPKFLLELKKSDPEKYDTLLNEYLTKTKKTI